MMYTLNNNTTKQLFKNIEKLPCDLKTHIFKTFIIPEQCNLFLDWLENNNAIDMTPSVYTDKVDNLIKELLSNRDCVNYLCENNIHLKKMYIRHYIKKEIAFVLMSIRRSFVTSTLMYMWH